MAEGFQQLSLNLWDVSESGILEWDCCKILVLGDIAYLYGKPRKFAAIEGEKLPPFGYVEFHQSKYKSFKEEKEPSDLEKFAFEIFKELNPEEIYKGKTILTPAMASSLDFAKQQFQLKPFPDCKIEIPVFTPKTRSAGNNKSYGMTPEQRLEFLSKQLGSKESTLSSVFYQMIAEIPETQIEHFLSLTGIILK